MAALVQYYDLEACVNLMKIINSRRDFDATKMQRAHRVQNTETENQASTHSVHGRGGPETYS